jgi:hypothetical protein
MFEFIYGGTVIIPSRITMGPDQIFSGSSGVTRCVPALPYAGSPWSGAQDRQVICCSRQLVRWAGGGANRGAVGL